MLDRLERHLVKQQWLHGHSRIQTPGLTGNRQVSFAKTVPKEFVVEVDMTGLTGTDIREVHICMSNPSGGC